MIGLLEVTKLIRPPDVSREGLKFYPINFLFLYHQSTLLSSHAVGGHQMYFGGSVIGKASTIGREISPPSPNFHRGQKCGIWRRFQHRSTLSRPRLKTQQDIRILKQKCNSAMIALCLAKFGEVGFTHP